MMIARWLETLIEMPRNLLEKKESKLTIDILERFDNKN